MLLLGEEAKMVTLQLGMSTFGIEYAIIVHVSFSIEFTINILSVCLIIKPGLYNSFIHANILESEQFHSINCLEC
jgi:hypothetical protein